MSRIACQVAIAASICLSLFFLPNVVLGQLVPGTGRKIEQVGDDFEDPQWRYIGNWPKSTEENNDRHNYPSGKSANGRWYEGMKRGQPDFLRRVPTPAGGLVGSEGSLMLRSLQTGIPGIPSYRTQQDDFIADTVGETKRSDLCLSPCVRTVQPTTAVPSRRRTGHLLARTLD